MSRKCSRRDARYLEKISANLPAGALDLAEVPDLPLPMIKKLSSAGITTVEDLRAATTDGRLLTRKGFGAKTVEGLVKKLARRDEPVRGIRLVNAMEVTCALIAYLEKWPHVDHMDAAGEVRRGLEVVSRLDLVARTTASTATLDQFAAYSCIVLPVRQDRRKRSRSI